MRLEQQVTSLELSKRLKELGVKQESLFYWTQWIDKVVDVRSLEELSLIETHKGHRDTIKVASAFTVAELGEMLPDEIADGGDHDLEITKMPLIKHVEERHWLTRYCCEKTESCFGAQFGETMAESMGKMLVYLLENNLLTPPTHE